MVCARSVKAQQEVWRLDQTASLGGHPTKVLGHPQVFDTPMGKAVAFDGVDDALFTDVHPLAGAATWTWEMIFKPDADGKPEQRIFHLQSVDPTTGADIPNERMLFRDSHPQRPVVSRQLCHRRRPVAHAA